LVTPINPGAKSLGVTAQQVRPKVFKPAGEIISVDRICISEIIREMKETKKAIIEDMAGVGQKLFAHSKSADFTARRGLAMELWPFIFGAGERMNGKAISQFLEKEQGFKLSSVTINKALKDPAKNWNVYFDMVVPSARVFSKEDRVPMGDLLFRKQYFYKPLENPILKVAVDVLVRDEVKYAASILRTKWFSIDWEIRLKARPFLEHRLEGKTGK
jgi:hypothetical protein